MLPGPRRTAENNGGPGLLRPGPCVRLQGKDVRLVKPPRKLSPAAKASRPLFSHAPGRVDIAKSVATLHEPK